LANHRGSDLLRHAGPRASRSYLAARMRYAIVRAWTALATALLTAAVADAGTEFTANLGWLGGSVRDAQHEAIVPTFLLGLAAAAALGAFVAFARIAPRDPLLRRLGDWRARAIDLVCALAGSALCTIAMEGYETRFGGLSPFDPRSVVLSHALALLVAFVVVAVTVRGILSAALRFASRAGELAAGVLSEFLHKIAGVRVAPAAVHTSAFSLHVAHLPPAIADGACGLRAPPRSTLPDYAIT
jgi:hypothetical protein